MRQFSLLGFRPLLFLLLFLWQLGHSQNPAPDGTNSEKSKSESLAKVNSASADESIKPVGWELSGFTHFSKAELDQNLADFIGKPIKFEDLSKVTAVIEKMYEKEGCIARALILASVKSLAR